MPAFLIAVAVPPDATSFRPISHSFLAKSSSPLLSDTLKRAKKKIKREETVMKRTY